jgi:hypothetical protein
MYWTKSLGRARLICLKWGPECKALLPRPRPTLTDQHRDFPPLNDPNRAFGQLLPAVSFKAAESVVCRIKETGKPPPLRQMDICKTRDEWRRGHIQKIES